MAEMPKVDENHAQLERLAGRWTTEETLHASPWGPGGTSTSRTVSRMAIGGFFLLTDYEQWRDGRVAFQGHSVHGWDPHRRLVVWYWVDSMGMPPPTPATGAWDGEALVMSQSTPHGQSRYTWRFDGPDRHRFSIESSKDGTNWVTFMEGHSRRER